MRFFARVAEFAERHARWLAPLWLLAAVALTVSAPSFREVGSQDLTSFLPADSASFRADEMLRDRFPDDPTRESALVVLARDGGLTDADRAFVSQLSAWATQETEGAFSSVQSTATQPELAPLLASPGGEAELAILSMGRAPFTEGGNEAVASLREFMEAEAPSGLEHHVTGIGGLAADQAEALVESFDRTAIVTVALVLLILVLVYRSAVAPLVPLVTIGVAFLVARGLIAFMAQAGFEVATMAETFMVVMVFGAGTDYCLFIVSRYREELAGGEPVSATLRRTMTIIGAVIAASAATVIVGFLSQITAQFGMYRTFGPAIGIAIFVTLVAGLTLTPSLLKLAGRFSFWPQHMSHIRERPPEHLSARWERVGDVVRRRPREVLLAGVILLLLPASGLGWMHQSFDLLSDLPASADARRGFDTLSEHYPAGQVSPVVILVADDEPIVADGKLVAVDRLTDRLRRLEGVEQVRSITQPAGAPITPEVSDELGAFGFDDPAALGIDPNQVDVAPLLEAIASPEGLRFTTPILERYPQITERLSGPFVGDDGASTRLIVSLAGNPFGGEALETFRSLDDATADALAGTELAGAELAVGGPTAFFSDMETLGQVDFRRITAVLIGAIFVILALLLRSLVAPFYLIATVLLSYFGTLGLTAVVFQGILGQAGIVFWLPPLLFIVLVALGADYNIFITSRIREEVDAGVEVGEAAIRGLVLTGRVITSAGLILAGTFAALMLAPLPNLRQIGFAVTVGVLIDTFVVRSLLVPAATLLLGRWAFWPGITIERRGPAAEIVPRWVGVSVVALAGVLLVAAFGARVPGTEEVVPTRRVATTGQAASNPSTSHGDGAGAGEASTTTGASSATNPRSTARESGAAPTVAGRGPESTSPPTTEAPQAPQRIAVPATGDWRYRSQGTRQIGLAGSPQSFDEEVTTEVSREGGSDGSPEMRLITSSSNGTEEQVRRYDPDATRMLETHVSGFGQSFGGTLEPPARLVLWPIRVGDTWSDTWTADGIQGATTSTVTEQRTYTVGATRYECFVVDGHTELSGDAQGTQDQQACWVAQLGMWVEADIRIDVTYNGIPVEIDEHRSLLATP